MINYWIQKGLSFKNTMKLHIAFLQIGCLVALFLLHIHVLCFLMREHCLDRCTLLFSMVPIGQEDSENAIVISGSCGFWYHTWKQSNLRTPFSPRVEIILFEKKKVNNWTLIIHSSKSLFTRSKLSIF
jgi:hypothetical protein